MSLLEKPALSAPDSPGGGEVGLDAQSQTREDNSSSESSVRASATVRGLKPWSWFLVVFALLAALFLFALDNTIVANVQENIIYTLGGIDKLPWISVAFALGAVATNLFWYMFLPIHRHDPKTNQRHAGVNSTLTSITSCSSYQASQSLKLVLRFAAQLLRLMH